VSPLSNVSTRSIANISPNKQEQRPVRSVAPAVLHPPGDDHCQKHVHHPKRVHPVGRRPGTSLEELAEAAHQPRHREASDNRGEDANVAKRIHFLFRLRPSVPCGQITGNANTDSVAGKRSSKKFAMKRAPPVRAGLALHAGRARYPDDDDFGSRPTLLDHLIQFPLNSFSYLRGSTVTVQVL
jgi:hypothetical protein